LATRHVLIAFVLAATGVTAAQSTSSTQSVTVWQGVYTEAQAARGQTEYDTHCARCHRDDLAGYNSVLKGQRFLQNYRETSLDILFDKTRTTMPRGAAGTLTDTAYIDIVAYVLKANEFPAGRSELRVVGCLVTNVSDSTWSLTHSTDPVRTGNPQPAAGDIEAAQRLGLGPQTFGLLVSAAYKPELHKGHKVEVRGFLIRRPAENRLNITSLETLDASCGE
jgi:mono/diheme cytochrome c family protein